MSTLAFAAFITILLCGSALGATKPTTGLFGSVITSPDGWFKIDTAKMHSPPLKHSGYNYVLDFTNVGGFVCGNQQPPVYTYVCAYKTSITGPGAVALTSVGGQAVYTIPSANKNSFEIIFENPASTGKCFADITFTYSTDSAPATISTVTTPANHPCQATLVVTTNHILAEVMDDPNFVGFYGQAYKVNGISGRVYNILGDTDIFVNAAFHHLNQAGIDTSYYTQAATNMQLVGLQYKNIQLEWISVSQHNQRFLKINGHNVFTFISDVSTDPTKNKKNTFSPNPTIFTSGGQQIGNLTQIYFDLFRFSNADYDIYVDFKTFYQPSKTNPIVPGANYFNIDVALNNKMRFPGGLLGETAHEDNQQPGTGPQGQGVLQDKIKQYQVQTLFTPPTEPGTPTFSG